MKRLLSYLFFALLTSTLISAQDLPKRQYKATRITAAPVINGTLDEEVWNSGEWIDDFTQHEPYNGHATSQRTEFKILFDDDNLYVGIKAFDTAPDSIINRLTRRDQVDGDQVGIILDSFHDLRTAFLFGASSSGVKFDQMFTNDGQNEDSSWDPNWWVKSSIVNDGWVAEMKIPFSQVRFEKNSGDVWGLEVFRMYYRKNEMDLWQHIPKDAPGLVHLFGELSGLEQIKPRKIFDVTPYGVAQAETFKSEPGNPFLSKGRFSKLNGGIDAKIGITNNMTMDLTVNPDFGQVEADPSEVNLSAYETFFTEKRPFFIEGSNITNFNIGIGDGGIGNDNLFYSRRIGRRPQGYPDLKENWYADVPGMTTILGAAKLTGKTKDGLSLGFMEAVTSEENAEIDTIGGRMHQPVEPLTNYFVGRVQKDYNEGKTIIGGIFTSTNRDLDDNMAKYLHKAAYSGGIDFTQYFKDKSWMFNVNSAFSLVEGTKDALLQTQESSARYFQRPDNDYVKYDPNRTSLSGSGGRIQLLKLNGHWNFMSALLWKTPGFETNDMGFLREADQLLGLIWAGYNVWEPKGIYRRYQINGDLYTVHNFGGDWVAKGLEWNANMGLKNYWTVWTGGNLASSSLSTGMLRGGPMMKLPGELNVRLGFASDNRKKVVFEVSNFASRGFLNSSDNINTSISINYKPINFLSISASPSISKSYTDLQYVSHTIYGGNDRYIFASIDRKTLSTSFRININMSPNLSLQYWGQPFIATGKYYDHKYITDPMAENYKSRFHTFNSNQIKVEDGSYLVDENADNNTDYSFGNNNFNYQEFLSNLVIRWEYNPGSSVYLVWSQNRSGFNDSGHMQLFDDLGDLFNGETNVPHNVFLIKFSYRFGLK